MAKKWDYFELKAKAKELGMNTNGKTTSEILAFVEKHTGNGKISIPLSEAKSMKGVTTKKEAVKKALVISDTQRVSKIKKETPKPKKEAGEKPSNLSKKIRELHAEGKTIAEIKTETGLTTGHYVNDIVWRINNPSGKKK